MKLLVIRCFRPDRMIAAVNNFVQKCLPNGQKYADCDGELNSFQLLQNTFEDSSPTVPLYFLPFGRRLRTMVLAVVLSIVF